MIERLEALRERLRLSLWFIPAIFAVAAAIGGLVLIAIDRRLAEEGFGLVRFGGAADGARSVLSTVAQSMLTFTGLVFTITMLVLQLAANQLSPRVMRTFLRDRKNQVVLGLFVATFLFTLLVLREVRSADAGTEFVPGLSVWASFALLVASIGAFIFYIDHMAHAIRASTVIEQIGKETRAAIDRVHPEDGDEASPETAFVPRNPPARIVKNEEPGTLISIADDGLVKAAVKWGVLIELVPAIGDFVPAEAPLFRIHREGRRDDDGDGRGEPSPDEAHDREDSLEDRLQELASFGPERTLQQDVAFGFRQLVDVAARALSPGTNDPTTAVQAIDQIHDLLRRVAVRPWPPSAYRDDDGRVRLIARGPYWDDYVALAFDELRLYGGGHLQVTRRLRDVLRDIAGVAPPERRPALFDQLARLDEGVGREFADSRDEARARTASASGQGPISRRDVPREEAR